MELALSDHVPFRRKVDRIVAEPPDFPSAEGPKKEKIGATDDGGHWHSRPSLLFLREVVFQGKAAVLQGIRYPLQRKPFKSGKLKLDRTVKNSAHPGAASTRAISPMWQVANERAESNRSEIW